MNTDSSRWRKKRAKSVHSNDSTQPNVPVSSRVKPASGRRRRFPGEEMSPAAPRLRHTLGIAPVHEHEHEVDRGDV